MKLFAWIALVTVLALAGIAYEFAVWHVCLRDFPWWYCLRILSR